MSNPSYNSDDQNDFQNLKRQARTNALRLKIAQQNAALAALRSQGYCDKLEGFADYDPSNYVNYRDYLFDSSPLFGAMPTTRNDRDEGRDFPIFRTEQELALIRGAARLVTAGNPIASGVLASLTNYVIGNGFHYAALPRDPGATDLAKTAGAVIDDFLEENNWSGDLDRELFQRSRIDGEYFLGLWHVGNGRVQARAIEPDQVTEPSNKAGLDQWLGCARPTNWTLGVHSDADDAQGVHGFYVQWTNRDQDWNYLPGGAEPIIPPQGDGATWMEHAKLNVVRGVKRGLSDFYPIQGNLEIARRVLRNMGEGSAVQAAIAWIQEMAPGTTQAQVNTGTMSRADARYTTPMQSGSRTHWLQQYDPATILKVPSGQKYLPGPLGAQNATSFITAAQALLRTVAVRWNLPENFVTGTAENNNFASSLVAESPFVKFAEAQQQFYAQRDRRTLQRVLWFAWLAGRFGAAEWEDVKRAVQITVTPPQIEVRDPEKETQVRKTLHDAGILSRKTWSAQESLDFEQEQKNLQQEAEAAMAPSAANPSTPPLPHPHGTGESLVEEEWDPAKHPRGGDPENRGRFSEGWGPSGAKYDAARAADHDAAAPFALQRTQTDRNGNPTFAFSPESQQYQSRAALDKTGKFIMGAYPPEEWLTQAERLTADLRERLKNAPHSPADFADFRNWMSEEQQRELLRKRLRDGVRAIASLRQPLATKASHVSFTPSDYANHLIKQWIDASSLSDQEKRIASNVNNIVNLRQEDILPFAKGLASGFFFDGLGGSLLGIKDLGSLAARGAIQSNLATAYLYSKWYGEEPLAPEGKAIVRTAQQIAAAFSALKTFCEELAAGGDGFLDALLTGDPFKLAHYSQLAQDISEFAGDMLRDVLESLTDVDAETRGRILGFVLYQIAEAIATEGASAALKAGAACKAARFLTTSDEIKKFPKVAAALERSIALLTTAMNLNICFVAGTPVHTPSGLVPIEALRVGDHVLTRPEGGADQANVTRAVTQVIVTHPTELIVLDVQTPIGVETLRCTLGHPFFMIERGGFIEAAKLVVGDRLLLADGGAATIVEIVREQTLPGECFTTYNFAVEECRTYFVGQSAIWAHNVSRRICGDLTTVYRSALRKKGTSKEAANAVVEHLAKLLAKPGAKLKDIEKELAKSNIPGISGKELLKRAKAKAEKTRNAFSATARQSASRKYRAKVGNATTTNYAATFFRAYPKLKGRVVVHHGVPQKVLARYPGLFTKAEIHSLENLRGIPGRLNSDVHLSKIRKAWNKFYSTHRRATRKQLLDKATEIDRTFGGRFTPPR